MAHKTPLKGCSLKMEILTRLFILFYLNLIIEFAMGGCESLRFFSNFKKEKQMIKLGMCVRRDVT